MAASVAYSKESELSSVSSGKVAQQCPEATLVTCHSSMVKYNVKLTDYKQLNVSFQFPSAYPNELLIIDIRSKTIYDKFLSGLEKVCEEHLREKYIGRLQIKAALEFIVQFLKDNPFVVCPEELSFVKKELSVGSKDEVKVKQKNGYIDYKAQQEQYFAEYRLSIKEDYPITQVQIALRGSNFPSELVQVFTGRAVEMARKCVEPPAMKKKGAPPFQPKPSLRRVAEFLVTECVRRYPSEKCPLCNELGLPANPDEVIKEEKHPRYVHRVYCGHLYHRQCLEEYLKIPPFQGGKKCPSCGERIFHDKFKISPRVAEERWAHQEARKREIAEVAEFLGV